MCWIWSEDQYWFSNFFGKIMEIWKNYFTCTIFVCRCWSSLFDWFIGITPIHCWVLNHYETHEVTHFLESCLRFTHTRILTSRKYTVTFALIITVKFFITIKYVIFDYKIILIDCLETRIILMEKLVFDCFLFCSASLVLRSWWS